MRSNNSIPTPLSKAQMISILRNTRNTFEKLLIFLAMITGMRRAEVVSLKIKWIDFNTSAIIHPNTKNGKVRRYEISDNFMNILKKWIIFLNTYYPNTEWIFPNFYNPKKHIIPQYYNEILNLATKKSGLDERHKFSKDNRRKYTTHSIRDTFCCILLSNDVDIYKVKELMGHSKVDTTLRYYAYLPVKNRTETINNIFNPKKIEVSKTEQNSGMDALRELELKMVRDEITEEDFKRKINLLTEMDNLKDQRKDYFG
jgi:integrase/recombinase XerD